MALFIYLKAKAYYAIGLYPIFFAFGSVYLSRLLSKGWVYYLRYLAVGIILFFLYVLLQLALPLYPAEKYAADAAANLPFSKHSWEDGKEYPIPQDFADMLGWQELAQKVDLVYGTIQDKSKLLLLCDNYGQAGAINYYSKHKTLQADAFVPDYIKWIDLDRKIEQVLRVKTVGEDLEMEKALFGKIDTLGQITDPHARERGTSILLMREPKQDFAALLRAERAKRQ